jgi:hypothetical protein
MIRHCDLEGQLVIAFERLLAHVRNLVVISALAFNNLVETRHECQPRMVKTLRIIFFEGIFDGCHQLRHCVANLLLLKRLDGNKERQVTYVVVRRIRRLVDHLDFPSVTRLGNREKILIVVLDVGCSVVLLNLDSKLLPVRGKLLLDGRDDFFQKHLAVGITVTRDRLHLHGACHTMF